MNLEKKTGYKKTKLGWIPEEWEILKLGDLGGFKNGINKSKEDFGFGVPFINLMDVFNKPVLLKDDWGLVNANKKEIENYTLKKGDVLFIRSSVKPSGVGLTSIIKEEVPNTVYSGFLIRYRPNNESNFDNNYLQYCFYENKFRQRLIVRSSSSANTNINQDNLKQLLISLPPLPEQQKIANILNTWDKAIATQEKLITQKQALKKGLMQQLLTGKKRFAGFSEKWELKNISEISSKIGDGLHSTPKYTNKGLYKFINGNNLIDNKIIINSNTKSVNKSEFLKHKKRLTERTILLSINGTIGNIAFYDNEPVILGKSAAYININDEVSKEFIAFQLQTENMRNHFKKVATGSTIKNLGLKAISKTKITLPSITEQKKIVEILKGAEDEIKMRRNNLDFLIKQKQGLMQQLLTGKKRVKI